jgi:predicted  nucleic acid-binding Zn-ribbon protein
MVLSEILSTSFLFSIAIIIILVGGLFAYFNHRICAQNHKISSMLGLVSTMAEEMQYFRSKISGKSSEQCKMSDVDAIHFAPQFLGGNSDLDVNLIEVSDGEDDIDSEIEDDDSDSDSDSDDGEDSDDGDSDDGEDSEIDDSESDDDDDKIKTISIDLGKEIDLNIGDEIEHDNLDINHDTKTINLSEDISSFDITSKTLENVDNIDDISIDLNVSVQNKLDYKKMSLNKLRDVVTQKGLVVDASKLKKNDILKMLGDE